MLSLLVKTEANCPPLFLAEETASVIGIGCLNLSLNVSSMEKAAMANNSKVKAIQHYGADLISANKDTKRQTEIEMLFMDVDMEKLCPVKPKVFYGKNNTHIRDIPSDSEDSILQDDIKEPDIPVGRIIQDGHLDSDDSDDDSPLVHLLPNIASSSKASELKWASSTPPQEFLELATPYKNF
ncbi:unnamed protein product [Acanthoscelides obtectus]|uniref:Uncharacterized protein n=1 Tax=Acanthoscelides obtectus TaxID=200917 RepID=A0A9P0PTK5_ACAOB|nr:unnamed protein product [Acanthoscelides obtectus]CAK1680289.1 hypothetical protein AOBTE_LOCUS32562 [Acanthoscelides obtectus]